MQNEITTELTASDTSIHRNESEGKINIPLRLDELMAMEFSETKWLVEKLIPAEGIIALSGSPSSYKTFLMLDLAISLAKGVDLFDKYLTRQTGVLIIDEETGSRWLKERVEKMSKEYDLPIYILSKTGFKLNKQGVDYLLKICSLKDVGLVIFDSFVRVSTARDENNAVEVAKMFTHLQKLNKAGITTVFTHHNRKPGVFRSSNLSHDMRGSSDILAAVDCHIAIEREDNMITVTQTKLRQGEELQPFKLEIISDENEFRFEYAGEVDIVKSKKREFQSSIEDILKQANIPMYKKELYDRLKGSGVEGGYSTFKTAVEEMVNADKLYEQRGDKNKVYCSLSPFPENGSLLSE